MEITYTPLSTESSERSPLKKVKVDDEQSTYNRLIGTIFYTALQDHDKSVQKEACEILLTLIQDNQEKTVPIVDQIENFENISKEKFIGNFPGSLQMLNVKVLLKLAEVSADHNANDLESLLDDILMCMKQVDTPEDIDDVALDCY
jgi:hypothetical protein